MSPTEAMNAAAVLQADARDPHQPQDLRRGKRLGGQRCLQRLDLLVEKIDLSKTAVERQPLVDWQLKLGQPRSASLAEAIGHRRPAAEVTRRHGVRLVFRACAGTHKRLASGAQTRSARVRSSGAHDRLQETRRRQPRERARVQPVGLRFRLADLRQPARVGDQHRGHVRLDDLRDQARAARRLQRHHVVCREAPREQLQHLEPAVDPACRSHPAIQLSDRDLAEVAMHVHPDEPHRSLPPSTTREAGGRSDKDGYVLTAHPGKSQGRPRTTPGSQPIGYQRPAPPVLPRSSPCPGTPILTLPAACPRVTG